MKCNIVVYSIQRNVVSYAKPNPTYMLCIQYDILGTERLQLNEPKMLVNNASTWHPGMLATVLWQTCRLVHLPNSKHKRIPDRGLSSAVQSTPGGRMFCPKVHRHNAAVACMSNMVRSGVVGSSNFRPAQNHTGKEF